MKKLADRQGVDTIDRIEDILPVCFDHRVLKNYPIQIIENRDFAKLTIWLDKLTAHDLTRIDLSGLKTIEEWLGRLEAFGMLVTYSSGTTGKLSFVPRSYDELGRPDGYLIRRRAVDAEVPLITDLMLARAVVDALRNRRTHLSLRPVDEYMKRRPRALS